MLALIATLELCNSDIWYIHLYLQTTCALRIASYRIFH